MSRPLSETTTVSDDSQTVPFVRRSNDTPAHQVVGPAHRSNENVPVQWITGLDAPSNTFGGSHRANATSAGKVRIACDPL